MLAIKLKQKIKEFCTSLSRPFLQIDTKQYNVAINNKDFLPKSVMLWDI